MPSQVQQAQQPATTGHSGIGGLVALLAAVGVGVWAYMYITKDPAEKKPDPPAPAAPTGLSRGAISGIVVAALFALAALYFGVYKYRGGAHAWQ